MPGRMGERRREMVQTGPIGQCRIVSGKPGFDRQSDGSEIIHAAARRMGSNQTSSRLAKSAGIDHDADRGDAAVRV